MALRLARIARIPRHPLAKTILLAIANDGVLRDGKHLAVQEPPPPKDKPRWRFLVAIGGILVLAFLSMGFAFAWIYRQGISTERPWLMQGLRFGLAVAFLTPLPMYLIYYVVQPMEGATTAKQIIGDSISFIVAGIVVAFINGTGRTERA